MTSEVQPSPSSPSPSGVKNILGGGFPSATHLIVSPALYSFCIGMISTLDKGSAKHNSNAHFFTGCCKAKKKVAHKETTIWIFRFLLCKANFPHSLTILTRRAAHAFIAPNMRDLFHAPPALSSANKTWMNPLITSHMEVCGCCKQTNLNAITQGNPNLLASSSANSCTKKIKTLALIGTIRQKRVNIERALDHSFCFLQNSGSSSADGGSWSSVQMQRLSSISCLHFVSLFQL